MATNHVFCYRQYEIRIVATTRPRDKYFHAVYEIQETNAFVQSRPLRQGMIVGAYASNHEAEESTLRIAMKWIDDHRPNLVEAVSIHGIKPTARDPRCARFNLDCL